MDVCGDGFELPRASLLRMFVAVALLEFRMQLNFEKHPTGPQLLSPRLEVAAKYWFSTFLLLLLLLLFFRDEDGLCRRDRGLPITRRTLWVNFPGFRSLVPLVDPSSDVRASY